MWYVLRKYFCFVKNRQISTYKSFEKLFPRVHRLQIAIWIIFKFLFQPTPLSFGGKHRILFNYQYNAKFVFKPIDAYNFTIRELTTPLNLFICSHNLNNFIFKSLISFLLIGTLENSVLLSRVSFRFKLYTIILVNLFRRFQVKFSISSVQQYTLASFLFTQRPYIILRVERELINPSRGFSKLIIHLSSTIDIKIRKWIHLMKAYSIENLQKISSNRRFWIHSISCLAYCIPWKLLICWLVLLSPPRIFHPSWGSFLFPLNRYLWPFQLFFGYLWIY